MIDYSKDVFFLRWRYDLASGVVKFGQWDKHAHLQNEMAAFQNQSGLIRASIEGKRIDSKEIFCLAEVNGQDFVNFQWLGEIRGRYRGPKKIAVATQRNIGMNLISRDFNNYVYKDGTRFSLRRTEAEKSIVFETFGR